jgi:hypothetical protein
MGRQQKRHRPRQSHQRLSRNRSFKLGESSRFQDDMERCREGRPRKCWHIQCGQPKFGPRSTTHHPRSSKRQSALHHPPKHAIIAGPKTAPFINKWLFLSVNRGETPNCKSDGESLIKPLPSAGGKEKLPHAELPGREELHFEGSPSSCEYLNDGKSNPGKLWCGGTGFDCFFETQKEQDCSNGFPGDLWQQPKVHCEWSD